jgi:hypothetical protein
MRQLIKEKNKDNEAMSALRNNDIEIRSAYSGDSMDKKRYHAHNWKTGKSILADDPADAILAVR